MRCCVRKHILVLGIGCLLLSVFCGANEPTKPEPSLPPSPVCEKTDTARADDNAPTTMVADWGQPIRLGEPVNTPCPQDAIEISRDGSYLYVMYTEDVLNAMTSEQILARYNNTYRLKRIGGPDEFAEPEFYDLGKGISQSFNGELSFAADGSKVYFHSLRATNQGYLQNPPTDDYLAIYVADVIAGVPGPGRNLGPSVNSVYPDGEQALHPDGVTLFFASSRPGGSGGDDIWTSTFDGVNWSDAVNIGSPVNSWARDYQPAFTADGDTMYFASERNPVIGMAIYRSIRVGSTWNDPQLVMRGLVGEPTLTADGQLLYFVHVRSENGTAYDADIWYCMRTGT